MPSNHEIRLRVHHHEPSKNSLCIILTTISSDSHTWNLIYLQLFLEELGHRVINLGPCVPDEIIIEQCREERADLLIVSSVNGHGNIEGVRLVKALRSNKDLRSIPSIIGGKLGIHGDSDDVHLQRLIDAGFDAVFEAPNNPSDLRMFLNGINPPKIENRLC